MPHLSSIGARAAVALISLYQRTLSPDHSWLRARFPHGYCRFHPTCSEYGKEAITKYGLWRGGGMALARIGRCHPGNPPKHDPVL